MKELFFHQILPLVFSMRINYPGIAGCYVLILYLTAWYGWMGYLDPVCVSRNNQRNSSLLMKLGRARYQKSDNGRNPEMLLV